MFKGSVLHKAHSKDFVLHATDNREFALYTIHYKKKL